MEIMNVIYNIILIPLLIGVCVLMYYMVDDIKRERKKRGL